MKMQKLQTLFPKTRPKPSVLWRILFVRYKYLLGIYQVKIIQYKESCMRAELCVFNNLGELFKVGEGFWKAKLA
jgi:hypothetical protein